MMLAVGAEVAAGVGHTTYTISLWSFMWLAIPVVICMALIRFIYLKFSNNGKKFIADRKRKKEEERIAQTLEKNIDNGIIDRIVDLTDSNHRFTELVQSMTDDNCDTSSLKNEEDKENKSYRNFTCIFSAEAPFILKNVSESFITFNNVQNLNELKMKYNSRNIIRNQKGKPLSATGIIALESGNDNIQIALQDIFDIESDILDELIDNITIHIVNKSNSVLCTNVHMKLTVDILNASIYVVSDVIFQDGDLIVKFNIERLIPKMSASTYNINTTNYKNVMRNLILDVEYPIIIVDSSGIRFMNKCTCDWFNIPYSRIDEIQNSELASKTFDDLFSLIDGCLASLIRETIKSSDNNGFYTECVINNKIHNLEGLSISKVPMEVLVHAVPFTSENRRKLIITIQSTNAIKEYIAKNNLPQNQKMDKSVSEFVSRITNVNEIFKGFFYNTRMVSFGRIDVNTRNVLACNDSFEELLKYDKQKDRYRAIIDSILGQYIAHTESEINFYVYTINYSDRETTIVYSYNSNVVDIVFLDRHIRSFLSNNSLDLLGRFYQTSDLPIVVVNKNAHILSANKQFEELFMPEYAVKQISESGNVSFLEFVPQKERNKIKRAIYDAVKFNCYNLNDVIIMNRKNNKSESCALSCIKTYSKINGEEFITITIFPNDKDKGVDD